MELTITKQNKNSLFDREDVYFTLKDTGTTPTRQEIRELIAARTSNKAENVAVISINSEYGKNVVKGIVHIYKSKEDLEKREPKHIIKRNIPKAKKEEEKPAEVAAPAETPISEEKPAEEKKEGEE